MDETTRAAAALLEAVPVNRLFGLRVGAAGPAGAEVALDVRPEFTNVIGTLHASGLIALLDAAGLAALLGAAPAPDALAGVGALGRAAGVEFLRPADGHLVATCRLDDEAAVTCRDFYAGEVDRASVRTDAEISDAAGAVVCRGHFDWRLRRG